MMVKIFDPIYLKLYCFGCQVNDVFLRSKHNTATPLTTGCQSREGRVHFRVKRRKSRATPMKSAPLLLLLMSLLYLLGNHRARSCCQICVSQFYKATDLLEVDEAAKEHVKRTFRTYAKARHGQTFPSLADAVIPLSSMVSDDLDTVSLPGGGFCCPLCPTDFLPPPPGLYDSNAGGVAIGVDKTIWDLKKAEDDGVEDDDDGEAGGRSGSSDTKKPVAALLQMRQHRRRHSGFINSALASANNLATAAFGTLFRPCCDLCPSTSFGKIDYDETDPPAFTRFLQQEETMVRTTKGKGFLPTSNAGAAGAQPPGSSTCGCTLCPQHESHFSEPVASPRKDRYHRNLRTDVRRGG